MQFFVCANEHILQQHKRCLAASTLVSHLVLSLVSSLVSNLVSRFLSDFVCNLVPYLVSDFASSLLSRSCLQSCLPSSRSHLQVVSKVFSHLVSLKHLRNVETCFYCPQAFLSIGF